VILAKRRDFHSHRSIDEDGRVFLALRHRPENPVRRRCRSQASGKIDVIDMSMENLALFIAGASSTFTQAPAR
jgi:hypothetical protein